MEPRLLLAADLVATAFDALTDHVADGTTDVTFIVQNIGDVASGAFDTQVIWSANDIPGDADDVPVASTVTTFPGLAPAASATATITVQLDRALLAAHAIAADTAGLPVGTESVDISHLFLATDVTDSVSESDENNNIGRGLSLDYDDITYFPWDSDGSGTITPLEAVSAIHAIGTVDPVYDFDGSGTVTETEAQSAIERIGYVRSSVALQDTPVITVALVNDTGESSTDSLTTEPAVVGTVTSFTAVARMDASFGDAWTTVPLDENDGSFSLNTAMLAIINGGAFPDGDYVLTLRATDNFGVEHFESLEFTFDTIGPSANTLSVIRRTGPFIDVMFDEPVEAAAFQTTPYRLAVEGGINDGQAVAVLSVEQRNPSTARLHLETTLPDQNYRLTVAANLMDLAGNTILSGTDLPFAVADPTGILELSPADAEEMVSVTRETILRFDEEINPATFTDGVVSILAGGVPVTGRIVVSSTNRFVTIFYDTPLPASSRVRVTVDGDQIIGTDGLALDADGDDLPGGQLIAEFQTLPLTRIDDTNVFGFVRDSETGHPLVGVTIRVDAFPEANVVTDSDGRFELQDMPAPEFFVHIDGSTVTHLNEDGTLAPIAAGTGYPNVGKPFHSVPGQTVQLEMGHEPFDVFLPAFAEGDIQNLSATQMTEVTFGSDASVRLRAMFPNLPPAMFDVMTVSFEPGSAVDDQGNTATSALVLPVEPDRIPAPLPSSLDLPLVVSIQAPGATNFDVPAAVSFPNVEGLAPGEKTLIYSFDHDAGKWTVVGTGTVSSDGMSIDSDSGVIRAPGWHGTSPGQNGTSDGQGGEGDLPDFCQGHWQRLLDESYDDPRIIQSLQDNPGTSLRRIEDDGEPDEYWAAYDEYSITIPAGLRTRTGESPEEYFARWPRNMNNVPAGFGKIGFNNLSTFSVFTSDPVVGDIIAADGQIVLPNVHDNNDVMMTERSDTHFRFTTLTTPRAGAHVFSGSREWGIRTNSDGSKTYYTRGIDNAQFPRTFNYHIQDVLWTNLFIGVGEQFGLPYSEANRLLQRDRGFIGNRPSGCPTGAGSAPGSGLDGPPPNNPLPPGATGRPTPTTASFYRVVQSPIDGSSDLFEQSGRTDDNGSINLVLPVESAYEIHYWNPELNQYGSVSGVTDSPRQRVDFGAAVVVHGAGRDTDGDGLGQLAEFVLGLNPDDPDTDGDGVLDLAEIQQGLDPLDNRGFPTGVIASIPLPGSAREVVVEGSIFDSEGQTAYVATDAHGLAIVDVSEFNNPILLGQIDLPGTNIDVATDSELQLAAVAGLSGGLHLVDVSDAVQPSLVQTIAGDTRQVDLADGIVFRATSAKRLEAIDALTGELLARQTLADRIDDVSVLRGRIYVLTSDELIIFERETGGFSQLGRTAVGGGASPREIGRRLFVTDQVAYVGHFTGYSVIDITDPSSMSGLGVPPQTQEAVHDITANGSGRLLPVTSFAGTGTLGLSVYDSRDSTDVTKFLTRFSTPGDPYAATVASGIAFVADGSAGLSVANYESFDSLGVAPTVNVTTTAFDLDPDTSGIQVQEGTTIEVASVIADDVQVRNVELLVDGAVVRNDVSFPFELTVDIPPLDGPSGNVTIEVRATDTGGNSSTSAPIVIDVLPDVFAPTIASVTPADNGVRLEGLQTAQILFSEPMDEIAALDPASYELINTATPGTPLPIHNVQLRRGNREVQLVFDPLPIGNFELRIDSAALSDRAGNAVGTGTATTRFETIENTDPGDTIDTALDLRMLNGLIELSERIGTDALGGPDEGDVYRFELSRNSIVSSDFFGFTQRFDASLYYDGNSDNVFDSSEQLESWNIVSETVHTDGLSAGTYFLRIEKDSAATDTPYQLTLSVMDVPGDSTAADPGNTPATAQNLGTLAANVISTADAVRTGDIDVYEFHLATDSTLTVDISGLDEWIDAYLIVDLNGNGEWDSGEDLEWSESRTTLQFVEALAAGTYFLWIQPDNTNSPSDNTAYALSLTAAALTGTQDAGDTLPEARDMGTLTSTPVTADDIIQTGDLDIYQFELSADSTLTVEIAGMDEWIDAYLLTDLNTNGIWDSGEDLEWSESRTTLQFVEALAAGTYFLWIQPDTTSNSSDNTAYTLSLSATALTGTQDAGNTLPEARDMGTLTTTSVTADDIIQTGDLDIYQFELSADSTLTVEIAGMDEWIDAYLLTDLNANGIWDSGEDLEWSESRTTLQFVEALAAGTYFLWIQPDTTSNSSDNTAYTLSLSATALTGTQDAGNTLPEARDMGTLTSTPVTADDIIQTGDLDIYRFELSSDSTLTVEIAGMDEWIDAYLLTDLNTNGIWDSGEDLEWSESRTTLQFVEALAAGTYFLWIQPDSTSNSSDNTVYTLSLSATALTGTQDAGDSLPGARDMGTLTSTPVTANDVVQTGDVDVYRFELSADSDLTVDISGLDEWIDVYLLSDVNDNGVWDSGDDLELRQLRTPLQFAEALSAGTYYVWIRPDSTSNGNDNTAYALSLSATALSGTQDAGDSLPGARDMGTLTSTPVTANDVIQTGDVDVYRFELSADSDLTVDISGLDEWIDVYLLSDVNENGVWDSGDDLELRQLRTPLQFAEALSAGTYYVWIRPDSTSNGNDNTVYTLSLSATALSGTQDAGDSLPEARDMGTLTSTPATANDVIQTGDVDVYRFELSADSDLTVDISGLDEWIDVYLLFDVNENGVWDSGDDLELRQLRTPLQFAEALSAGTYYVWIRPDSTSNGNDNTVYTLSLSATALSGTQDAGDALPDARDMGTLATTAVTASDVIQTGDVDVYRFELGVAASLSAEFSGLNEYVRAWLLEDVNGNDVFDNGESIEDLSSNSQILFAESLAAGEFFLWVQSLSTSNGSDNTAYTLSLAVTAPPPASGGNGHVTGQISSPAGTRAAGYTSVSRTENGNGSRPETQGQRRTAFASSASVSVRDDERRILFGEVIQHTQVDQQAVVEADMAQIDDAFFVVREWLDAL